jgi:hypothetical protein
MEYLSPPKRNKMVGFKQKSAPEPGHELGVDAFLSVLSHHGDHGINYETESEKI